MKRIYSIDIVRGIVMMIMALDHVRDLLHVNSIAQSPTDLKTTTAVLFFTRWITYLCAPIFVFLAGTSAYLASTNKDISVARSFLLKRGLWLIALEFSVVNFGLFFDAGFHVVISEVIAAIGFGFIMLALLSKISSSTKGIIGLTIILCHQLVSFIPAAPGSVIMSIVTPLFGPTAFPLFPGHVFVMGYPPIPWLGIMLTGFAAGKLFEKPSEVRQRLFLKIGAGALLFFVIVRYINIYGDPVAWQVQDNSILTFLSFMNVTKYPPSLLFCSVTLGVMFFLLAIAEQGGNAIALVYGRVPLFYFVIHFYLIHLLLIVILFVQGFVWAEMSFSSGSFGRPQGVESGIPLWAVYLVWIAVVAALYQPCRWFGQYKASHHHWWLRYI